jgi:hypothetical protein
MAGLVPRLRAAGDVVVTMLPGDDPVAALDVALSEVSTHAAADLTDVARQVGRLVLVIDQFEECWTRAPEADRDRFVDVIATALADDSVDLRVVATMRADLLDRPLEHPAIGQLVGAGSYVLPPLSPAELDDAIAQPAARVGVAFEDGVVPDLIAEAVRSPGALPLLQFTLTELYDRRVDGLISRQALDDVGGMAGSIGRRAEEPIAAQAGDRGRRPRRRPRRRCSRVRPAPGRAGRGTSRPYRGPRRAGRVTARDPTRHRGPARHRGVPPG